MKKILALFCAAVVFVGCASNHIIPAVPAVVVPAAKAVTPSAVPSVNTNVAVERAALEAAIVPKLVAPAAPAAAALAVSIPASVAVAAAPDSTTNYPVAVAITKSITKTTKAAKSHKTITVVIIFVILGAAGYFTRKYWLPLWKKLLAWIKAHNVVKDLENLADEAKTKIVVDFKDQVAKIDPPAPAAPQTAAQPLYTPAPTSASQLDAAFAASAAVPVHESSAAKAFASAEIKKA